jgi:hypothetical protein
MSGTPVKLTVQLKKDAVAEFTVMVEQEADEFVVSLPLLQAVVRDTSLTGALELMASKIKQQGAASFF